MSLNSITIHLSNIRTDALHDCVSLQRRLKQNSLLVGLWYETSFQTALWPCVGSQGEGGHDVVLTGGALVHRRGAEVGLSVCADVIIVVVIVIHGGEQGGGGGLPPLRESGERTRE